MQVLRVSVAPDHISAHTMLAGMYKLGGSQAASQVDLVRCMEAAKLRYKEVLAMLDQAFTEEAVGGPMHE